MHQSFILDGVCTTTGMQSSASASASSISAIAVSTQEEMIRARNGVSTDQLSQGGAIHNGWGQISSCNPGVVMIRGTKG
jgi:hypothetical protein